MAENGVSAMLVVGSDKSGTFISADNSRPAAAVMHARGVHHLPVLSNPTKFWGKQGANLRDPNRRRRLSSGFCVAVSMTFLCGITADQEMVLLASMAPYPRGVYRYLGSFSGCSSWQEGSRYSRSGHRSPSCCLSRFFAHQREVDWVCTPDVCKHFFF